MVDGSPQFHAGLVFQVSGSTDLDLEFEVTDEYFTNSDGSTLGYGTDYRGGAEKDGGLRRRFCGLTVTFLVSVSGRNE